jgi:hypothetical protein
MDREKYLARQRRYNRSEKGRARWRSYYSRRCHERFMSDPFNAAFLLKTCDPTIPKLERLMERGATEHEREAARVALERRERKLGYVASEKAAERRRQIVGAA